MKAIVLVHIPVSTTSPTEFRAPETYEVDDEAPDFGVEVAQRITAAVDTRADLAGRLAEFKRYFVRLSGLANKVVTKPDGKKSVAGRVQYFPSSRTLEYAIKVELRHASETGVAQNPDAI